jgi:hypothetical protein
MSRTHGREQYVAAGIVFVVALIVVVTVQGTIALAVETGATHSQARMFGLKLGYGRSFGTRNIIETVAVLPYFYLPLHELTALIDLGLVIEPGFFYYFEPEHAEGFGITPRLRLDFGHWAITPYVEAGVGLFYTDLNVHELGQKFNFTPQGEVGVDFRIVSCTLLNLGYRYHHISNAGMNERNGGVDSNMVIIGISRKF